MLVAQDVTDGMETFLLLSMSHTAGSIDILDDTNNS
jgi:hypothetical protein